MAPFISLILPVYNVEHYLARCVNSLIQQEFTDYEMILVDDGSTDGSGALCDRYAAENPAISVIHKENGGLASARNTGITHAQGRYIWFVDSDDWVAENALNTLWKATQDGDWDMVKFHYIRVEQGEKAVISHVKPGIYQTPSQLEELQDMAFFSGGKFVLSACTHLYKTQLLRDLGVSFVSEREVGSEDYLFNLQVLVHAEKICVISDVLYYYEQRGGSLTQCYKKDLPQRYEKLYHLLREDYKKKGLLRAYEGKLAAFYLWHLVRGTCVPMEYYGAEEETMEQIRKNVREMLDTPMVKKAYKKCDKKRLSWKKRLNLWVINYHLEPVLYWQYVRKPGFKKEKCHEN